MDGLFDFAALPRSLALEAQRLENRFATLWSADMDMVAQAIAESCPQWAHVKDELLDHPRVVQALVANVGQHYNSIGPLCNCLRDMLKIVRQVNTDGNGHIVDVGFLKEKVLSPLLHDYYYYSYCCC